MSFASASSGVTVSLATATSQTVRTGWAVTLSNFIHMIGSANADSLVGDGFNNSIDGGLGNDTLFGGLGTNTLNGNTGTDTVDYSSLTTSVTVSLGGGTATGTGINDTLISIEAVIGSKGADALTGSGSTISYAGGAFASVNVNLAAGTGVVGGVTDSLTGFVNAVGTSGNDTLTGDSNNNILEGGAGNDSIDGGSGGIDTASYSTAGNSVTVSLAIATAQNTGGAGTDTLTNIRNLTGSIYDDSLTGSSAANTIDGGLGNDTIEGGVGAAGDSLNGNTGTDTISYANSGVAVNVSLAANTGIHAGVTDTLAGFENILGSANNDTLIGDANANSIDGGAGNDSINGGNGNNIMIATLGNDTVIGGTGADYIKLATAGPNLVASVDGGTGTDAISLTGLGASYSVDTLTGLSNTTVGTSKILNIEQVEIKDSVSTAMTFTYADVRNLVNVASPSLTVFADSGDTLNLTPGGGNVISSAPSTTISVAFNGFTYTHDVVYTVTNGANSATIHWYT